MIKNNYNFPWGIYIGDLVDQNDTIPLCIDSKQGGICVLFDEISETIANNFIENIALKLFEVIPIRAIEAHIFDFGDVRFSSLSTFERLKLYDIAYEPKSSKHKFEALHELSRNRIHGVLEGYNSLSDYNKESDYIEPYYLLLINIEDFVYESSNTREIKRFFDTAFKAGFYTILFGNISVKESKSEIMQGMLSYFPKLSIENQKFHLTKELFEFSDMLEEYSFNSVDDKKEQIVQTLITQYKQEEINSSEQDFLSIPIGKAFNRKDMVYFNMGRKSGNYFAFITGRSGMGKTTLLNNLIIDIAKKFTSHEMVLYLMDYKDGTEFQYFEKHPNCKKLFLDKSDIQASVELLEEFNHIMSERTKLFKEHKVSSIESYNQKESSSSIPYILLIIDEVQELFRSKEASHLTNLLMQVTEQGRSTGVHFILTTQNLSKFSMGKALMAEIPLRVTYQVNERGASAIFNEYNIKEVQTLKKYELIYNDNLGQKEDNLKCRANKPIAKESEIVKVIEDIRATKDEQDMIMPVIVKSKKEESKTEDNFNDFVSNVKSREEEILAKLVRDGIKPNGNGGV